ncbi:MAG TPA: hypothetical protein VGF15_01495 [Solirubrobacteraceae bacterium]
MVKGPAGGLALGLTEDNPDLLLPAGQPVPTAFAGADGLLNALEPEYLRIDIDWATLEPTPGSAALLEGPVSGCARTVGPCAVYGGLDALLRTIAARQRTSAHSAAGASSATDPQVVILFYNAPAWATRPPSGCEASARGLGARLITPEGLRAYRQLVLDVLALERRDAAKLRWWSAWDEPNQPLFLAPQRASCELSSPSLAPAVYATLVRTLAGALAGAPGGPHELVLGELADVPSPHLHSSSIAEFVDGLPADVLCRADVWAIHEYPRGAAPPGAPPGNPGDVALLQRALDARGPCAARARIWVSETGVGNPHAEGERATSARALASACQLLARALLAWYHDPRVDVAFQYTFREDPLFPVGLLSADLTRVYPTYYLLKAWAGGRPPAAPPPATPPQCE